MKTKKHFRKIFFSTLLIGACLAMTLLPGHASRDRRDRRDTGGRVFTPGNPYHHEGRDLDGIKKHMAAEVYAAVIPPGMADDVDILWGLALNHGSKEVIVFDPREGPLKHQSRRLIRTGDHGVGYPGFSVHLREGIQTAHEAHAMTWLGENLWTLQDESGLSISVQIPRSVHEPLSGFLRSGNDPLAYVEIYEIPGYFEDRPWPVMVRNVFYKTASRVVQFYRYLDDFDDLAESPANEARKDLSPGTQGIHAAGDGHEPSSVMSSTQQRTEDGERGSRGDEWELSNRGNFSVHYGLPSIDWDSKWQPGGHDTPGFPLQVRVAFGAGCNFSAQVDGNFRFDPLAPSLGLGGASGRMGVDVGANFLSKLCVNTLVFDPFILDIPWLPNFDLRIQQTTGFNSYLLGSRARIAHELARERLFQADLVSLMLIAMGIKIPGLSGGIALDAALELEAVLSALSLTTTDNLRFTRENQTLPVRLTGTTYRTAVSYNEKFDVNTNLNLFPTIFLKFSLGPISLFAWDLPVAVIPWTILSRPIDLNFSTVSLSFSLGSITVTYPNSTGITWETGKSYTIRWASTGDVGRNVRIDLYKGGQFNRTITSSTPNNGSYAWTVSTAVPVGNDYKIKVTSTANSHFSDFSDHNFAIKRGTTQIPEIEMVYIPPGEFMMGSNTGYSHERPAHQVRITKGFWMGKYEVTQGQWRAVMGNNPSRFQKGDNYPVETVSWHDVQSFIQKLNQLSGKKYRLPTEAEWEYACRAGTTGDRYGNLNDIAWWGGNSTGTQPVGLKLKNAFGLYDTLGNVGEWVQDWYDADYYSRSPINDPPGPASGTRKINRGGGIELMAVDVRAPHRESYELSWRHNLHGFRLARTD